MQGEFYKNKNWLLIVCPFLAGIFIIYRALVLLNVAIQQGSDSGNCWIFGFVCLFGLFCIGFSCFFLSFNKRKDHLTLTPTTLRARYFLHKNVNVAFSDIVMLRFDAVTLHITTKQKKAYRITPLKNSEALFAYIQKTKAFRTRNVDVKVTEDDIRMTDKKRKTYINLMLALFLLIFIELFLVVFLTGGAELSEFARKDWVIFACFVVVWLATWIFAFFFAGKGGRLKNSCADVKALLAEQRYREYWKTAEELREVYLSLEQVHFYRGRVRVIVCGDAEPDRYTFIQETYSEERGWEETYTGAFGGNRTDVADHIAEWMDEIPLFICGFTD